MFFFLFWPVKQLGNCDHDQSQGLMIDYCFLYDKVLNCLLCPLQAFPPTDI